ncbi:MAG: adenine deaminase C-terminal domain-containing protein [Clostridia bacterium]
MINLEPKDKEALINCAMGKIPADLCITNVRLVNVLTGEIYPADIYVYDKFIAHVEKDNVGENIDAKKIVDGEGKYIIPGLIDSHVHIESSMLTPRNFAKCIINHGTTTIVTDPHEIANVYGREAVKYMHDASDNLPMRQLIDIPSCVPAVPGLENSGAEFFAEDIFELAKLERVVGLAEVMDYIGVVNCSERMMSIIQAGKDCGLYIQGHAPFVSGRMLSAYVIGGARTCHESRSEKEFVEKLRVGMSVDVRESSISKNAREAVLGTQGIKFYDNFCSCTDDRESHDLIEIGHINTTVKKLVASGMDAITAIKSATFNTARQIKIENLGAIAPGYIADMLIVESLSDIKPSEVYFEGELVSKDGKLVKEIEDIEFEIETRNSINLKQPELSAYEYKAPIENGTVKVNIMCYDSSFSAATYVSTEEVPVKNGVLDISHDEDLKYITVFNRYGKGTIGYGITRGFGTKSGAVASTVSHDSHNMTVVYDTKENAKACIDALIECKGGLAVSNKGKCLGTIPLQVGGLMSINPAEVVAKQSEEMKEHLKAFELELDDNPLLRIVTCALPVIPECKMSDLGLVDVLKKEIIPLFAK